MINIKKPQTDDFSIDISSLVDVIFTLIIFFSLTSTFVKESGLNIELPEASSSGTISSPARIDITLSKDGSILLDQKKITMPELESELLKFDNSMKLKYVMVLNADNAATHGNVTALLDLLNRNGFKNIAIGTKAVK